VTVSLLNLVVLASVLGAGAPVVVETLDVAPVWAGHPVSFCLLTHGDRQFASFYDADRTMTVAVRALAEKEWHLVRLPEQVGWDSHNYITMAVDDDGFLHLSGNMHVDPLVYFRTQKPLDIDTFARAPMVGEKEDRTTYPRFLRGAKDELLFTYRDGKSGNGDQIYNVYDTETKTWRRLLDAPLTSGQGKMNAYLNGPLRGPDERFHLCWVWRDTSGCELNHDPCYARSDDLVHWETGAGVPIPLPMTIENADIVDPVPVRGGIINGNTRLGFDSQHRPVVSYHKFDEAGNTQIYSARLEDGAWKIYQTTDWDYRWEFSGGGSIRFEIRLSSVQPHGKGTLEQGYRHDKYGSGTWLLDETTLKPIGTVDKPPAYPKELSVVQSDFPEMQIRRAGDLGRGPDPATWYILQWETLGRNRDHPREGPLPPPSMLKLVTLRRPR